MGILLDKGLRAEQGVPDPVRCMDTYWFHLEMLIKYFKRGDVFKLLKNIDFLFHAHADLLIAQYDTLDYGAPETKIKHCVPLDKQAHLLAYFAPAEPDTPEKADAPVHASISPPTRGSCARNGRLRIRRTSAKR